MPWPNSVPLRTFRTADGVEWAVHADADDPMGAILDWGRLPAQDGDVVLIFSSREGPRRLIHAPPTWLHYGDRELAELCERAARLC